MGMVLDGVSATATGSIPEQRRWTLTPSERSPWGRPLMTRYVSALLQNRDVCYTMSFLEYRSRCRRCAAGSVI